jgi:hypothetical protein
MNDFRRRFVTGGAAGAALACLNACAGPLAMISTAKVPAPRLDQLFARTKLMCFGRYAVELPEETEQIMGFQQIAGGFEQFALSDYREPRFLLQQEWDKVARDDRDAQILTPISDGPVRGSKYMWFYDMDYARRAGLRVLRGAVAVGSTIYLYRGMTIPREGISADTLFERMSTLMRGMRAWDGTSVPREPGVCIDGAFIHEPTHRFQEIMSSGFVFPSLPDVHFSVMSNKNASTEGDNGKGLLQRVDEARREQVFYPYTMLRSGPRVLHGLWDGEEVLARRGDGALQFNWELVGERGNVARPPWLEVSLRTRVADNKVGAALYSAISDEQAVALWDRLLENLKFRVAVPGATAQSVALG